MQSWVPLISSVTALVAVFLSPCVTLYIARRQIRANTITGFRQEWINTLRNEISELFSQLETEAFLKTTGDPKSASRYIEITRSISKIHLLLNPKEPDHIELMNRIDAANLALRPGKDGINHEYAKNYSDSANLILMQAQIVLKREWKRVKKFE